MSNSCISLHYDNIHKDITTTQADFKTCAITVAHTFPALLITMA